MSEEMKPVELVSRIEPEEAAKQLIKEEPKTEEVKVVKKPMPLVTRIPNNTVEERKFLILFVGTDEAGDEVRDWIVCSGRNAAYHKIVDMMENDYFIIDLVASRIVAATETMDKAKSLYKYMTYIIENDLINFNDDLETYPDLQEYVGVDIFPEDIEDGIATD